jgi:hypothetical protein
MAYGFTQLIFHKNVVLEEIKELMDKDEIKVVQTTFINNITKGIQNEYQFGQMDHALHMEKTQDEVTIQVQKILVTLFVLSGIIGANMEQSRLIMNCTLQCIRGKIWSEKPKFIFVAILCATQFTVNIIICESVYHLLSISTNIVEILKNSLTALLLN